MSKVLLVVVVLFAGCKTAYGPGEKTRGENIITKNEDSDKYEVIIIDPGFDRWFSINSKPMNFHTLSYYEQQNRRYVQAWNEKVDQQAAYHTVDYPFENHIYYDTSIDYGLELNYKLYYYFKYIEETYGELYDFP